MRTYAEKPKAHQQPAPASSALARRARSAKHNRGGPVSHLQRTDSSPAGTPSRLARNFTRIPVNPGESRLQASSTDAPGLDGAARRGPWGPLFSGQMVQKPIPPAPPVPHHSPPATGAGSRGSPKVPAAHPLAMSAMNKDTWYRAPANARNPVIAWTDGSHVFLSPSQGQIDAGRRSATPEVVLNVPTGYAATELHWDQYVAGTKIGSAMLLNAAPLVVLAQKKGADDQLITVSTDLQQTLHFMSLGKRSGSGAFVTLRDGMEMLLANETRVARGISGAGAKGPIHSDRFRGGYIRYRAGGTHDLYMNRSGKRKVCLVERSTGAIDGRFSGKKIDSVVAEPGGKVNVEEQGAKTEDSKTHTVDLKASPPTVTETAGITSGDSGYQDARAKVEAHGVKVIERGARLSVTDLSEIDKILTESGTAAGFVNAKAALVAYRDRKRAKPKKPILVFEKLVGLDQAGGDVPSTGGTPRLHIQEPFRATPLDRVSTIRHEMTHIVMGVKDRLSPAKIPTRLEDIFNILSKPNFPFLADVEGTGSKRGTELVDESRYSGGGDTSVGHPEDNVGEFAASFVACARLYWPTLTAAIFSAQEAGDKGGGTAGTDLLKLYQEAWDLIDAHYMPLGKRLY